MNTDILISTIRDEEGGLQRESLPSFYEIVLVDQIDNMLKPAFRQLLDATLESLPASMIELVASIREYWEELYDIIILVVQIRLIRSQGATVAERLYGLQRRGINVGGAPLELDKYGKPILGSSNRMLRWQQDISIFMVAVLPRIVTTLTRSATIVRNRMRARQRMLDAQRRNASRRGRPVAVAHESGTDDTSAGSSERGRDIATAREVPIEEEPFGGPYRMAADGWRSHVRSGASYVLHSLGRAVRRVGEVTAVVVPYAVAGCGAVVTVQRLRYLFGYSPYHHPILGFAKTVLVRRNPELHDITPPLATGGQEAVTKTDRAKAPDYRLITLVSLVVVLKVMHWVTQQEEANADAISLQPHGLDSGMGSGGGATSSAVNGVDEILPPPPPPSVGRGRVVPSSDPALKQESCPLCKKSPRVSECASTGGYLFCFTCLLESLRRDETNGEIPRCPVTGIPCREKDIIMMHAGGG